MTLDKVQNEIVHSTARNIIVSAGAGSGKTRVLTERVKYLIESGINPNKIVCITFTNKAANEMRERLAGLNGVGDAFIGTIHSFANHLLKDSGERYDLLTAEKEAEIVNNLIAKYAKYATQDDYAVYIKAKNLEKLGAIEERAKLPDVSKNAYYEIEALRDQALLPKYMQNADTVHSICKKKNIITFDELIKKCTAYFRKINGSIDYLMVDELQDIGMNEYEFLMALNADHNFMVGDDWQSIYSFKGSDVHIFLHLMKSDQWTPYYMSTNYRNATGILDLAKIIIKQADDIIDKKVVPSRIDVGYTKVDLKSELPRYIRQIKKDGNYKDWFILVRTNKDIYEITKTLDSIGVPNKTFKQAGMSSSDVNSMMKANTVKVLTVHSAKGLESKNVIVYGDFPIKVPSYRKIKSEERKIFYVACTRAMDKLIVLN